MAHFMELYNGLQSSVSLNRKLSQWFPVKQGVRQGGILSTFLYFVFVNDLLEEIQTLVKFSDISIALLKQKQCKVKGNSFNLSDLLV